MIGHMKISLCDKGLKLKSFQLNFTAVPPIVSYPSKCDRNKVIVFQPYYRIVPC